MKNVVEVKKKERKVFTEKEDNSRIKKNYKSLITLFIDEENYQQAKKKMCKEDDYFSEKELEEISVILA